MLALVLTLAGWTAIASASGPGYSFGGPEGKNANCLDCHGTTGKVDSKHFIDPVKYTHTNHAKIGCPACHDSVAAGHPAVKTASGKADCRFCHDDIGDGIRQEQPCGKSSLRRLSRSAPGQYPYGDFRATT